MIYSDRSPFKATNVGRKEGTRFMPTIVDDRLPLSLSPASPFISHIISSPFLLHFYSSSLSLFLSISLSTSRSFCFSLFATRRCVWSVVAAARVDSLITLSSSSGPLPLPLLLVLRAPSRPRCRRGKRVKRYRRSRARSANRLL